jgi:hypothetical protein
MGYKKKSIIDMGNYTASPSEFNAFKWCIDNGIYISPYANSTLEWYICITMNNKSSLSPSTYKKIDVWKQMYRFYLYYYNKYNNDIKIAPMLVIPKKEIKVKQQVTNNKLF